MTLNDIRNHLIGGGTVCETMRNGDVQEWKMEGGNISIDHVMKNFAFRSAAGISIFNLMPMVEPQTDGDHILEHAQSYLLFPNDELTGSEAEAYHILADCRAIILGVQ